MVSARGLPSTLAILIGEAAASTFFVASANVSPTSEARNAASGELVTTGSGGTGAVGLLVVVVEVTADDGFVVPAELPVPLDPPDPQPTISNGVRPSSATTPDRGRVTMHPAYNGDAPTCGKLMIVQSARGNGSRMSWSTADIPDQSGRVAVITGANGGLGLESARALAGAGAHVVLAVRNQDKARAAVDDIRATIPDASLELVALDLGSLASVAAAAESIAANHVTIDILLNNAGLMACPERQTVDGFEMQFGVNHLGHWALSGRLLPNAPRASAPLVATVTISTSHGPPGRP